MGALVFAAFVGDGLAVALACGSFTWHAAVNSTAASTPVTAAPPRTRLHTVVPLMRTVTHRQANTGQGGQCCPKTPQFGYLASGRGRCCCGRCRVDGAVWPGLGEANDLGEPGRRLRR